MSATASSVSALLSRRAQQQPDLHAYPLISCDGARLPAVLPSPIAFPQKPACAERCRQHEFARLKVSA
jgi:hypothetical protein